MVMSYLDLESIARACGGASRSGAGWVCRCPAHDDKKPSLSLALSDGTLLAKCHSGCDFESVIGALKERGMLDATSYGHYNAPENTERDYSPYALKLWSQSRLAGGTPVETYLQSRGYTAPIPDSLRYLSSHKHTPSGLYFPIMVAGVSVYPASDIVAVHRTYLSYDGTSKAPVTPPKKMLGSVGGGAVRFGPCAGNTLWVAEGIETALSIFLATGQATWATLSTSGMKAVILPSPDLAPNLCIATDNDPPGIEAAHTLAAREMATGRTVRIAKPPKEGQDFNDLLREDTA